MPLPADIHSVDSVRAIDRAAIESGIAGYTLMCRAAEAALRQAMHNFPNARRWQVVCGAGNNAGDGYALARLAAEQGIAVSVVSLVGPHALTGDAKTAYEDFAAAGGAAIPWHGALDDDASLLVDGLLGSGLSRDVDGPFADAVRAINAHPAKVMALDVPSGIDGNSGRSRGTAVVADLTVTFVGLKAGLFLQDGVMCRGALEFADLGIAASLRETQPPLYRRIDDALLAAALPRRRRDAHKGDFGHLLIVGGGPGMPGAVRLCGEAALRCGAGKVSVATHPEHAVQIVTARPELMCHGIRTAEALAALVGQATTLVLGPGLGQDDWGREMYAASMAAERPTVLDADALNLLARDPQRRDDWVLTPHPGEAGRLLGSDGGSVQQDRPGALKALHARYGGTVVLKGAGTLLTAGGQSPFLCSSGNPGMASPGMGDVLAGVIGALLAQGLAAEQAAAAAVEVHARAGDLAAQSGERGLLASDLLACLRQVINR